VERVQGGETDVTALLQSMRAGDPEAGRKLYPLVYDELHRLAAAYMRRERPDHTLQPTALIHEAYLRLTRDKALEPQNRAHFIAIAATVMRRVLVDHARRHNAGVHGGGRNKVGLTESIAAHERPDELVAVDEALERLEQIAPRQAKVVELRFFAGLSVEETAALLNVAPRSVKRDWALARIWLYQEIRKTRQPSGPGPGPPATPAPG
jgi:RNA polymerase sigma factor (TIGR02999 family)